MMLALTYSLFHFDSTARNDEREIVTVEKEKVITKIVKQYETVVVEKDAAIAQKTKEVNHVAKQRDAALAEVAKLKSSSNDALERLREQMAAAIAQASGDAERSKQLIATQGRILTECGQEARQLGQDLERLAAENRDLRARLEKLKAGK